MDPLLTGIAGILIGGLLGHRLALGRDKRKEYNEVVRPIKQKLLVQMDVFNKGEIGVIFQYNEISILRTFISSRKYGAIIKLHQECVDYMNNNREINNRGYEVYSKECCEFISANFNKINKLLKLK